MLHWAAVELITSGLPMTLGIQTLITKLTVSQAMMKRSGLNPAIFFVLVFANHASACT